MGKASNASSDGRRWSETPLAHGLLFLGIVWSIAGAFLVLQSLLPELVEQIVTRGWVSPDIAVNRKLDEEAQRRCAEPQTATRPAPSPATLQRARYAAYQMGFGFGTAAVAHTSGTNQRELIVRALQEVQREAPGARRVHFETTDFVLAIDYHFAVQPKDSSSGARSHSQKSS